MQRVTWKMAAAVRIGAGFDIFDPGAADAERDFVLAFAGNGAGVAADALTVVNDKTVIFACGGQFNGHKFLHFLVDAGCRR